MEPVLELRDVSKKLGGRQVIDHVSFTVEPGEVFGFLGPNGAGKTTTIKMIVGLLSADSGEILIDGINIKKNFETAMRNVGGIIENPELYGYLTGKTNLKMFGRMYGKIPKARYDDVIAQVKLTERIDDKVKKYSLGMRQRLGVAQALLHKPKLLILDEPTNGLDPAGIKELRDNLRTMTRDEGLAVLVSSHLLSEMELMCDRFGIIDKGVLTGTKSLTDIRQNTDDEVLRYTLEVDDITKASEIAAAYFAGIGQQEKDELTDLNMTRAQAAELNTRLVRAGLKVYALQKSMHSLEDAFFAATEKQTDDLNGEATDDSTNRE